jgi:hypothetical protein
MKLAGTAWHQVLAIALAFSKNLTFRRFEDSA